MAAAARTRLFALIALGLALDALAALLLAGGLRDYAQAFGVPLPAAGLLFSASGAGFVAAVPLSGLLGDRCGKRAVAAWSAAVLALGLLLFAVSPSLPVALAAAVVIGAGAVATESAVAALVPDAYPGREGFAVNLTQVFFCVGAMAAPPLLLPGGPGWRLRLASCGAACALLAMALAARGPSRVGAGPVRVGTAPPDGGPWVRAVLRVARERGVGRCALAMALYTGVEVSVWGWLYAVVTRPGGAGPAWAAVELASFWAAMAIGRAATGALAARWPLPALIAAETALGLPALLLALLAGGRWAGLLGVVACGLAFSGIWPSVVAQAQRRFGGSAFVTALMVAAGGAGSLVVPAAFGLVVARAGLRAAALALAGLLAPVALLPALPVRVAGAAALRPADAHPAP